ncbi:MAG: hypothetical protein VYE64_06220, partial [Planctomycetota bacterium]|nr:hypothetical protein [Planctomycetota bacterium]
TGASFIHLGWFNGRSVDSTCLAISVRAETCRQSRFSCRSQGCQRFEITINYRGETHSVKSWEAQVKFPQAGELVHLDVVLGKEQ